VSEAGEAVESFAFGPDDLGELVGAWIEQGLSEARQE
jgi:hypothetical protein